MGDELYYQNPVYPGYFADPFVWEADAQPIRQAAPATVPKRRSQSGRCCIGFALRIASFPSVCKRESEIYPAGFCP